MSETQHPFIDKLAVSISEEPGADKTSLTLAIAEQFNLPIIPFNRIKSYCELPFILLEEQTRLALLQTGPKAPGPIYATFIDGAVEHRRKFGGGKGQLIAKAVGLNKKSSLHVVDATAGLGKDAFVLATLGSQVTMLERSPIVAAMLKSALDVALDSESADAISRMQLFECDGIDWFKDHAENRADVVYLDPMYPQRDKSSLVKKEMRAFKELVGGDQDDALLLKAALDNARYRVVVKRPRKSDPIQGVDPTFELSGKTTRYDIYVIKAFT